jgi:hypothetical protein
MDKILFAQVETFFSNLIYKHASGKELDHMNICCEKGEKQFLMHMGSKLYQLHGNEITLKDIYITLIYTYYALNLGEQTTDVLNMGQLHKFADNHNNVKYLFALITTGDIIEPTTHNSNNNTIMEVEGDINISSQIRRHMFGMPGGAHTRKKKHKRRKIKRRRTKRRQTKSKK